MRTPVGYGGSSKQAVAAAAAAGAAAATAAAAQRLRARTCDRRILCATEAFLLVFWLNLVAVRELLALAEWLVPRRQRRLLGLIPP